MSIKATGQLTIKAIADLTYEDICTHDTTTGLIECTHAQDQGCVRVEIQGKSEQVQSTQGKNLFNGVFHDGFINLNTGVIIPTQPDNPNSIYSDFIRLYSGKSYIASGHDGGDMRYRLYNLDGSFSKSISSYGQYTSDGDYYVRLLWYQGLTNEQKSKIQLEEGTTSTAYEPFTSNSPSPDYPSVINSVGDSGKLNVVSSVGRRNLIPNTNQGKNGWTYTPANNIDGFKTENFTALGVNAVKLTCTAISGSWGAYISHSINRKVIKNNTKYTLAFDVYSNITHNHGVLLISGSGLYKLGDFGSFTTKANDWVHVEIICTTNGETSIGQVLYFTLFNRIGEVIFANLQMVEGDSIDKYSPAPEDITPENSKQYEDKLSLATVKLISPLRSLPNGIHDVLECKDGIWGVTRNVGKIVLNGSESWVTHNYPEHRPANTYVYYFGLNNTIFGYQTSICSNFKNLNVAWSSGDVGTYSDHPTNACKYFVSNLPTVAEFKTWLSSNNITMSYPLATPTWEPLDDSSQKALNNLLSYSGKDYIYITDPLGTNFSVAVKSRAFYENFKLQEEIKNTNTSLGDLDDEIKGGFYDGIINTNEAEAIRKAAETMHTQVTNQFNKVDSNPSLTGAPKTTHQTKYTECNNAYNTLISKINTAIDYCSVNSTKTDAQKKTAVTDMNTAFGTYKTKLADYQKAYQDAIDAIAKKKAEDAVDGVVIGGRNLFRQSGHWEKLPDTKYWGNNGGTLSLDTTIKYLGYNTLRTTVGSGINGHNAEWLELDTNKIYTYSAMILTNANVTGSESTPLHFQCSVDKINFVGVEVVKYKQSAIANQWTLLYVTFKPKGRYWRPFVYMGSGSTIFNIAYLKLEEGTKATDWTPNSEDTDEKITQVSATLTSTINDVKHTVDKNTKSITDKVWKSDIITGLKDLNVGGINLWDLSAIKRYNSGSLSTLTGATVDAKTGKITVTANLDGVPGCKIDASTLTRNTSNVGELVITGYYDRPDSDSNKFENVYLYYKCFNSSNAEVQTHTKIFLPIETSSKLFAATISIPANTAYINLGIGQFPYIKSYTLTGITVKDSALYDITKGLRDQVSQAYQDINGFKQTVSDTYTTKTEFDQLSIGGRNLLLDSGRVITTTTAYNVAVYGTSSLKPNTKYTFVINGFTNSGNSMWVCFNHGNSDGKMFLTTTTAKTQYIAVTTPGTLNSTAVFIYNYPQATATNATINWACMYEGEIKPPLDWTPAPEDTDEKFTNYTTTTDLNSLIKQTKENIELGVSRAYTSKAEGDKITQGLNKWILEVYQLTSSSMPNPRVADIENIRGKVPTKIVEVADTAMSSSLNVGDYYIGHAFTYLYFDAAYTWSGIIKTDDEGSVYLNGVKKVSTAADTIINISLPFQAGWNVLEVVYNEATGNDGWVFGSQLSKLTQCKIMNCYAQVSLNASALIKVTADAISQKVENDAAYAEFTEQAGKMAWLVKSGTAAANMELTPEALNVIADKINLTGKVTFSSLATDAKKKIEEAKQAGTDAQESLNNLTLSGRNLLRNTSYENNIEGTNNRGTYHTISRDTANKYNGNNSLKIVCNTVSISGAQDVWQYLWKEMIMDKPVTVSFYIKGSVASTGWIRITNYGVSGGTKEFNITTSWTRVTINLGKTDASVMTCLIYGFDAVGTYYINSLMLEYATKPSDWSAAPEDISASIAVLGDDLQDQIDGKIESYNQTTNPADAWTTAAIKTQHTGDIWYDDSSKLTQRWSGSAWLPLKDADALAAQELAKQKRRVFTATPTTPYDVGDLWVQGGTGDIMKCKTALASGSYNVAHWEKASKYTDDTTANQAVSNTVLTPADKISLYATFLSIQNEYSRLKEQCSNLGVTDTLKTSYDALYALLNGIVGTIALQNATTTGFNKSNYDTLYKNYVTAREVLEQAQITKVYAYTNTIKEHFTTEKALAVANWFAQQDKTMIDGAYIYTGTVTAKQITAENISGTNGWINLSKGTFNYNNKITWDGSRLEIKADSLAIGSSSVATQSYVTSSIAGKVDSSWMTQKNVFDKLTNNGSLQGIYMEGGKLYINGEYIKANSIDADRLIIGMNPNLVRYAFDTMEQYTTVPYFTKPSTTTVTMDDSQYYVGTKSIKLSGTTASNYVLLGSKTTDYGCIPVVTGKKYILSCYVKTSSTTFMNVALGAVGHTDISTSSLTYPVTGTKILRASDGWVRCFAKFTATSDCPYISMRINVGDENTTAWFDAFQLEEVDDINKEPGTFKQAGTTIINGENITTGIIKSANYNYISGNFATAGTMIKLLSGSIRSKGLYIDDYGRTYLNGEITTTGGTIACWEINQKSLFKGSAILGKTGDGNIYLGNDGLSMSDKFIYRTATGELEINGKILASSGYIGDKVSGFTIGSKAIYNGMTNLASAATGIYLGTDGISLGGGKIKATSDGKFYATDATINGIINATSGSFNGDVTASSLSVNSRINLYLGSKSSGIVKQTTWSTDNVLGLLVGIVDYDPKFSTIQFYKDSTKGYLNLNGNGGIGVYGNTRFENDVVIVGGIDSLTTFSGIDVHAKNYYVNGTLLSNIYQAKGSYAASNHTHTAAQVGAAASSHEHGKLYQDGTAVATTSNGGLAFRPDAARGTGKVTLGTGNYRWSVVYATNGTINVSDRNDKTNFQPIDERYEKMFMDLSPELFQWKNFTSKDHHDRLHCGLIAQNLEEALLKNNLSAETFAALCKDNLETPTPDGRLWQYGVNYGELHGLEIHMIQKTIYQVNDLKKENEDLKFKNEELTERLDKLEKIVEVL